jgi:hypothetical protein
MQPNGGGVEETEKGEGTGLEAKAKAVRSIQ